LRPLTLSSTASRAVRNQDRQRLAEPPCSCQDREAIAIRQAEIKDRDIIIDQLERGLGIGCGAGNVDGKAGLAEIRLQYPRQPVFILDH
jgi:hypothetical protein